ncbi:MAG: hypothetical protein R2911_24820 [Caldilineaceae bacterium]
MMKPYAFHSLFCAFAHLKYGLPEEKVPLNIPTIGKSFKISKKAVGHLRAMAEAHETRDVDGQYSEYVKACLGTTTKSRS